MTLKKYQFVSESKDDFFGTVRSRVNFYFKSNKKSKYGNGEMIMKTMTMFALYLAPYGLMLSGVFTTWWIFMLLWVLMGIGVAGIGLSVMHDANHGVYSSNKVLNKWLGYTMNFIGSNAMVWKIQHNVLHHSYTNIEGADDDITVSKLLRLSPHQEVKWFHSFQYIYAWFAYCMMTLQRIFVSDFTKLFRYKKMGLIKPGLPFTIALIKVHLWKLFYLGYILILPMVLVPVSPWLILLGFVLMNFVAGFILAIIFQTAHIVPSTIFPLPDQNNTMKNSWAVHELMTTSNFAPASRIFSWCIGGLNYQVEHHLFADVCHVHYRKISKIVAETAREFDLPYNSEKTFLSALKQHTKMLKALGKPALATA